MTGELEGLGQDGMVTPLGVGWGGRLGESLQHDHADLFDTLNDGLRNASNGDCPLR
ncbi:hypothetical protein I79_023413 [Cricetulus griseus]|uniref:Uncharacterized protein n=1 Tax=Cricetulus griseus TaxID=10029 RepID=G3IHV8_CRIGR|nr:hypothetical protein I79_023413 [Cricetulus griseus]